MAAKNQTRFILRAMVVMLASVVLSGCQSFDFDAANSRTADTAEPIAEVNVIGQYQMQLIPSRGKPSVERIDITGPVTVQDALEASGALSKFGRMKISLGRIIKDRAELLKLPVEYQIQSKSVRPEQNYQVLPGDTITVSPQKSDRFEKLIKSATGGLI